MMHREQNKFNLAHLLFVLLLSRYRTIGAVSLARTVISACSTFGCNLRGWNHHQFIFISKRGLNWHINQKKHQFIFISKRGLNWHRKKKMSWSVFTDRRRQVIFSYVKWFFFWSNVCHLIFALFCLGYGEEFFSHLTF